MYPPGSSIESANDSASTRTVSSISSALMTRTRSDPDPSSRSYAKPSRYRSLPNSSSVKNRRARYGSSRNGVEGAVPVDAVVGGEGWEDEDTVLHAERSNLRRPRGGCRRPGGGDDGQRREWRALWRWRWRWRWRWWCWGSKEREKDSVAAIGESKELGFED